MCCIKENKIISENTIMMFYQKTAPEGWKIIDKNINTGCIICIKIEEKEE